MTPAELQRRLRSRAHEKRKRDSGYDWAPGTPCAPIARGALRRLRNICGYCGDGDAPPGERCRDCAADVRDVRARWDG